MTSQQTVLVVDDVPDNIDLLRETLQEDYRIKVALSGPSALRIVSSDGPPDIILLDVSMPEMDGFEVCQVLKSDPDTAHIPVLFVTAAGDEVSESKAFDAGGVDYITKPISPTVVRARVRTHLALYNHSRDLESRVASRTDQLNRTMVRLKETTLESLFRLSRAAEFRDESTGVHVLRVGQFAEMLARRLGLPSKEVHYLQLAAPLHDIGKIGIPDRVLLKPGRLNDVEFDIIRTHTVLGGEILEGSKSPIMQLAKVVAMTHHERWDGTGYSAGLAGEEIPLPGRIVAVVDVFDALTMRRPYKEPFPPDKAFEIIREGRGSHFDPRLVDAFLDCREEVLEIRRRLKGDVTALTAQIYGDMDLELSEE